MTALIRKLVTLRKVGILMDPLKGPAKDVILRCTLTIGEAPIRTCIEIAESTKTGMRSIFIGHGLTEDDAADDLQRTFRRLAGSAANFRRLLKLNNVEGF
jgi:hypothetical protein